MKANRFSKYLNLIVALCLCIAMILPILSCAETGGEESGSEWTSPDIAQTIPPETEPEETEFTYAVPLKIIQQFL